MAWALEPIQIKTARVSVRTYTPEDFSRIAEAINDPQGWFGFRWNIDTPTKIETTLKSLTDAHKGGVHNPLVYQVRGEVAGITRLLVRHPKRSLASTRPEARNGSGGAHQERRLLQGRELGRVCFLENI
jgi:hypothetical protein